MHRALLPALLLSVACYQLPEDLPRGFDGVTIEPTRDFCANPETDVVSCVLDGDTFDVGGCGAESARERFRLLGIDAPEIAHDPDPAECYAAEAAAELARLIDRRTVLLEYDSQCEGAFGRTLVWPHVLDEDDEQINVSLWLVENGFVRLYEEDSDRFKALLYAQDLVLARDRARAGGLGLWSACDD